MSVIFLTFENNGYVNVQKVKDITNSETKILPVKRLNTFLEKSEVCGMTELSRAFDRKEVDGNIILLEIGEKIGKKGIRIMVEM